MTAVPQSFGEPAQARDLSERRKLGAFYTPERLSQILSDWAIQRPADTILEPSFGGCGFLASARDRLAALGSRNPVNRIFGCDLDPVAFQYLANVLGGPFDTSGFIHRDFLDCFEEPTWPPMFSVILANPPYIPHHRIGRDRVRELWARPQAIPGVGGRSGLWAYFLSHAVGRLAEGGRMAWVLPGAFLQADYAAPIRRYLGECFERSVAFLVRERLFLAEGTDEETVILLADGHRRKAAPGEIEVGEASTLDELESRIADWSTGEWRGVSAGFSPAALSLSEHARAVHGTLSREGKAVPLGTVARVQIGLVTGDNQFFVLARGGLEQAGLHEEDCLRVLSKFRAAPGVALTLSDLDGYDRTSGRTFLVTSPDPPTRPRVAAYLETFDPERRESVSTFRKRAVWSATSDGNTPDAFLPVMHHTGPRLVLNPLGFNCTNTIHRVFFREPPSETDRRRVALSMLSTFSQVSAELCGRRYGSGVLKHEPRDAEKIELLLPQADCEAINLAYLAADARLRTGDVEGARAVADAALYAWSGLTISRADEAALASALVDMRTRRRPNRSRPTDHSTSAPVP